MSLDNTLQPLLYIALMKADDAPKSNFFCTQCEKSFRDNYNLRVHLKAHLKWDGKGPLCPICHKAFPTPSALRYHTKTHEAVETAATDQGKLLLSTGDAEIDEESSEEEVLNEPELSGFAEVRCHICEINIGSISFERHMKWHERSILDRCEESSKQLTAYLETLQQGREKLKDVKWRVDS